MGQGGNCGEAYEKTALSGLLIHILSMSNSYHRDGYNLFVDEINDAIWPHANGVTSLQLIFKLLALIGIISQFLQPDDDFLLDGER